MKTTIFISLILLIPGTITKAQFVNNIIFKIGINQSNADLSTRWEGGNMDTTVKVDSKTELGYRSSLQIDLFKNKYFKFAPELGFIQNISSSEIGIGTFTRNRNYKFEYLFINLQIKGKFPIKKITPYVAMGTNINYLLSEDTQYDKTTGLSNLIYGMNYTLGVGYELKDFVVLFELSKLYDLKNVVEYKESSGIVKRTTVFTHKPFSINFGIAYKL